MISDLDLKILALQVIAGVLGTLSIGGADWLYHRARIGQPLHALWVSSSSAVICLPLLTWTINVFLGVGLISWVLVSTFGVTMLLWMYRNLLKVPSVQESRSGLLPLGSAQTPVPPSSNIKG
jgi:hypothetical protein